MAHVLSILLRQPTRGVVQIVDSAVAVVGKGLDGDRYAQKLSHTSWARKDREVTLIEQEALVAAQNDAGFSLTHAQSRRNILTEGVRLNDLVGKSFRIGAEVVLRGIRRCLPCSHLEETTQPGVIKVFFDRGGLRAQVVRGGTIQIGDAIEVVEEPSLFDAPSTK